MLTITAVNFPPIITKTTMKIEKITCQSTEQILNAFGKGSTLVYRSSMPSGKKVVQAQKLKEKRTHTSYEADRSHATIKNNLKSVFTIRSVLIRNLLRDIFFMVDQAGWTSSSSHRCQSASLCPFIVKNETVKRANEYSPPHTHTLTVFYHMIL